jgi:hypothetical protein
MTHREKRGSLDSLAIGVVSGDPGAATNLPGGGDPEARQEPRGEI